MNTRKLPLPEAQSLDTIRAVVRAIAEGQRPPARLSPRHVNYHRAAARVLGWIDDAGAVTDAGDRLLATRVGSDEEAAVMRASIVASEDITAVASGLLTRAGPTHTELASAIERAGYKETTARKRATALLEWRNRVLQTSLAVATAELGPRPAGEVATSMLRELTLESFKAFGDATSVSLAPFTLLLGPNGAGKTTILQAVDLLGGLVRSTLPAYLHEQGWDYSDLPHLRASTRKLSIAARVEVAGEMLEWRLELGSRRHPGIAGESVIATRAGQQTILLSRKGRTMSRRDETSRESEQITQTLTSSWLASIDPESAEDGKRFPRLVALARWARDIRGHFFLDPRTLRSAGRGEHHEIGPHGENLAPFLHALKKGEPPAFNRVLKRIKHHYPRLHSLETRRAAYGWTQLEVEERWNGEQARYNARQVSDGLLRLVAVAAMMETTHRSGVLLLDEVENGMHPHLLGGFMDMLQDYSARTQVIATSHSPLAANFCRSDDGVVIVDRGPKGRPRAVALPATRGYRRLRPHFDAGELWYNLGEEKLVK